ncbi:MAG: MBL fold metallo-hydrolase [Promethearchaeota archaeon]
MKIRWITHASFLIDAGGQKIYTDPYKHPKNLPGADIILISHDHHDHADATSIKRIKKPGTRIVCPVTCTETLKHLHPEGMNPGDSVEIGDIKITGFPSYTFPGKSFHPRENKWLGFIVEAGGKKVYHAGDCDIMEEMKQLKNENIDVAILPVGDKGYTMDFNDAARATRDIMPKIVVPMHNWDKDLEPFRELVKKIAPGVKVEILLEKTLEI